MTILLRQTDPPSTLTGVANKAAPLNNTELDNNFVELLNALNGKIPSQSDLFSFSTLTENYFAYIDDNRGIGLYSANTYNGVRESIHSLRLTSSDGLLYDSSEVVNKSFLTEEGYLKATGIFVNGPLFSLNNFQITKKLNAGIEYACYAKVDYNSSNDIYGAAPSLVGYTVNVRGEDQKLGIFEQNDNIVVVSNGTTIERNSLIASKQLRISVGTEVLYKGSVTSAPFLPESLSKYIGEWLLLEICEDFDELPIESFPEFIMGYAGGDLLNFTDDYLSWSGSFKATTYKGVNSTWLASDTTGFLAFAGNTYADHATLSLRDSSYSTYPSSFELITRNNEQAHILRGTIDGLLSWNGAFQPNVLTLSSSSNVYTTDNEETHKADIIISSTNVTNGTNPSRKLWRGLYFTDSSGVPDQAGRLANVEQWLDTDGTNYLTLSVNKFAANKTSFESASFEVSIKPDGTSNFTAGGGAIYTVNKCNVSTIGNAITRSGTANWLRFTGGETDYTDGASLMLYGKNHSTSPGTFGLSTFNGSNRYTLSGNSAGVLTWSGPVVTASDDSTKIATTAFVKDCTATKPSSWSRITLGSKTGITTTGWVGAQSVTPTYNCWVWVYASGIVTSGATRAVSLNIGGTDLAVNAEYGNGRNFGTGPMFCPANTKVMFNSAECTNLYCYAIKAY